MNFWKHLTSPFTRKEPTKTERGAHASRVPCSASPPNTSARSEPQRGSSIQPGVAPKTFGATLGSAPNNPINPERVESKPPNSSPAAGEGELNSQPSPFDNLSYNRNGKIARLSRELRDRINLALYNRCTAKDLARALNQMPEVKAVLAQSFNGRPLKRQNIDEWKHGGYRDWLHHRHLLEQKRELAADAKDLSDSARGTAESLFGILTLNYADLIMNRDKETPEEFEKKRKELSLVSQDISRMHRCHINARRVEVQETRLDRDEEKTTEQLHFKFMEWVENPAIRRACILEPMEANRRSRQHFGMTPTSDDILVEKLTRNDPYFNPPNKKPAKSKPKPAEKSHPEAKSSPTSSAAEEAPKPNNDSNRPTVAPSPGREGRGEGGLNTEQVGRGTPCPPSEPQGGSSIQPGVGTPVPTLGSRSDVPINPEGVEAKPSDPSSAGAEAKPSPSPNPYGDKTTSQIIAEIEEQKDRESKASLPTASASNHGASRPTATPSPSPSPAGALTSEKRVPSSMLFKSGEGGSAIAEPGEGSRGKSKYCGEGRGEGELNSKPKPQNSSLPKPPLSDYERALLEGKTHLEALYLHSTPARPSSQPASPPARCSAWDSFSQPVDVYAGFRSAPASGFKLSFG